MSDFHALIRACKDEPEDVVPRLILADWLEEHGDADRAAFIRRQVANLPDVYEECPEHHPEWLAEWKRWADAWLKTNPIRSDRYPVQYVRGFMAISDVYTELFDCLTEILSAQFDWTWVERINFGCWHSGDWTPLFDSALFLELSSLAFSGDLYSPTLALPLARCPYVKNLHELLLDEIVIGDDGALALSESRALPNVRKLKLSYAHIGSVGAVAIAESPVWDRLRTLNLRQNSITDEGLSALSAGRKRPSLEELDLTFAEYTDDGLREFARSEQFPALRRLTLGYRDQPIGAPTFGRSGLEAILASQHFEKVAVDVWVSSPDPVPQSLRELATAFSERLTIHYHEALRRTLPDLADAVAARLQAFIEAENATNGS